jgi:hypothetical protein
MPRTGLIAAVLFFALAFPTSPADAAERYIDRPMTLHGGVLALDPGIGIGHLPRTTGPGLNLEAAYGITDRLEVGLRTGLRLGDDGKATDADTFGRVLGTETWNVAHDTVANPEARIRWVAYSGSVAEVGIDGRIMLPVEDKSRFGVMFGVPLAFHISDFLRIDTGAYLPIAFYDKTTVALSIPGYFWFQTSDKLWLGPMAALRFYNHGFLDDGAHLLLGFGMGYQVHPAIDLKWQILFPAADNTFGHDYGLGFGAQFRIGD